MSFESLGRTELEVAVARASSVSLALYLVLVSIVLMFPKTISAAPKTLLGRFCYNSESGFERRISKQGMKFRVFGKYIC